MNFLAAKVTYRHCPRQGVAVDGGQVSVDVQTSLVPQGWEEAPMVQGTTGGGVNGVTHSPPQVDVGVHIEPVGQGTTPLRMQDERGGEAERVRE